MREVRVGRRVGAEGQGLHAPILVEGALVDLGIAPRPLLCHAEGEVFGARENGGRAVDGDRAHLPQRVEAVGDCTATRVGDPRLATAGVAVAHREALVGGGGGHRLRFRGDTSQAVVDVGGVA